jgi:CheY-like chemotaxis protein
VTVGRTILVVEDEPLLRLTVVEELAERGYTVLEAEDAETAFGIIEGVPGLDLLFTDIRLPGRHDGWHVAEAARRRFPGLPVLYTTGYAPDPQRAVPDGKTLRKPYPLAHLLLALREAGM